MQKVSVTVEVPKETHELAKCAVNVIEKIIKAKKSDSKLTLTEAIGAVTGEIDSLLVAVDGIEQVPAEAKESGSGVGLALMVEVPRIEAALKA